MSTFNVINRQITNSGHVRPSKRARGADQAEATNTGSLSFIEEMKEEIGASLARFKSSRFSKDSKKRKDELESTQRDYVKQIEKIPDLSKDKLKQFAKDLLQGGQTLKESDIGARLKRAGFSDPSHIYLALRYAKDVIADDLKRFSFSESLQAIELYSSRLQTIETYLQYHMERSGEEVFAGVNSGEEQEQFSKMGLGTPQVLRDYYRSIVKEHKTVLNIYRDIIDTHGIGSFKTRCDFLMKFVSRHLESVQGRYDSVKLELMHKEIHLLRSVQSELDRVEEFFGQYDKDKAGDSFIHGIFEQVVSMVESVSVKETQVSTLHKFCKVVDPKSKIAVVNNLIACISSMPDLLFSNTSSRIKMRMMIYNLVEKLMLQSEEGLEQQARDELLYRAKGGFNQPSKKRRGLRKTAQYDFGRPDDSDQDQDSNIPALV